MCIPIQHNSLHFLLTTGEIRKYSVNFQALEQPHWYNWTKTTSCFSDTTGYGTIDSAPHIKCLPLVSFSFGKPSATPRDQGIRSAACATWGTTSLVTTQKQKHHHFVLQTSLPYATPFTSTTDPAHVFFWSSSQYRHDGINKLWAWLWERQNIAEHTDWLTNLDVGCCFS